MIDLGRWISAQRHGWEQLVAARQWLPENSLGLEPAAKEERVAKRTQDAKWAVNLAAARQFHAREGHLMVPRKHVEHVAQLGAEAGLVGGQNGVDGAVVVKHGTWLDNVLKRVGKLTEQRRADLDAPGARW
ncbi:helicase associated domain-containing protein [Streptomyces sp. NPDC032161]|uniref:helicase associated domain-containing protein n=1 Tax=unclassified Streptomyces TaxID=2593676 RepID=UPI0033DE769F